MSKDAILMNLEKGLASEHRAWELCDQILQLIEDEGDRTQVARIKADEEKHIKITEHMIEVVKNSYSDEFGKN